MQHHIEHGLAPRDATMLAMDQVAGPVIAVGLVLSAVFVPCVFIGGIIGEFYRQFAVTIAISTLLSAFNSLTLSPALCALLLTPPKPGQAQEPLPRLAFPLLGAGVGIWLLRPVLYRGLEVLPADVQALLAPLAPWLVPFAALAAGAAIGYFLRIALNRTLGWAFQWFNAGFEAVTGGYIKAVSASMRVSAIVILGYGGLLYMTYYTMKTTPSGFIPAQDKGYLLVNVQLPDASSLGRTGIEVNRLDEIARRTPGVSHTVSVAGQSVLLNVNAPNFATLYVMLDEFPNRHSHELSADAIAAKLQAAFNEEVSGAIVNVFGAPPVDGLGTAGGFKMVILDPSASEPAQLEAAGRDLIQKASENKDTLRDIFTGFRADTPWLYLDINRIAAQVMGVPVSEIINALQVYFGSLYVNDFNRFGRTWQVNLQAASKYRKQVEDLRHIRVKNPKADTEKQSRMDTARRAGLAIDPADETRDTMVPIGVFLSIKEIQGPVMVQRYKLYSAITVNATPAPGVSSGQAIAAMERAAAESLPPHMRTEWTELAFLQQENRETVDDGSLFSQLKNLDTASKAFLLSVLLVFLVLAAQYESWTLPLAVILVVPMCLLSAAIGVRLAGLEINIFTQIGFVVLVGLA
ncbi:MAG TPA: efflux RND transporter permease subunit, partial [Urbifossiella sp.]